EILLIDLLEDLFHLLDDELFAGPPHRHEKTRRIIGLQLPCQFGEVKHPAFQLAHLRLDVLLLELELFRLSDGLLRRRRVRWCGAQRQERDRNDPEERQNSHRREPLSHACGRAVILLRSNHLSNTESSCFPFNSSVPAFNFSCIRMISLSWLST